MDVHIRPTRFFKTSMPEMMFETDRKILEKLVIIEKICIKLIFGRYISLD